MVSYLVNGVEWHPSARFTCENAWTAVSNEMAYAFSRCCRHRWVIRSFELGLRILGDYQLFFLATVRPAAP